MTAATGPTTVSRPRWCATCRRAVTFTVRMLLPRPRDRYFADRWDDGATREIECAYQAHVAAHEDGSIEAAAVGPAAVRRENGTGR